MTREEKIFEMAKMIAPQFVKIGFSVQQRLIDTGHNPAECTVDGKSIPHAYGESVRVWAEAFVDELDATNK